MTDKKPHPLAGLTGEQLLELARKYRQLRSDLTDEQKAEALRIGRIEFTSAGQTRQR